MVQRSIRRTPIATPAREEQTSQVARRRTRPASESPEPAPVSQVSARRRLPVATAPLVETSETLTAPSSVASSRTDYDRIIATYKDKATTPKNAIRAMCVTCMGGMIAEVNRCSSDGCPLYPFRLGKNPYHKLSKNNQEPHDE